MRTLLTVSAIMLTVSTGALAASAYPDRGAKGYVPYPPRQAYVIVGPGPYYYYDYHPYESRHYDQHFDMYPVWAQRAFTPGWRR